MSVKSKVFKYCLPDKIAVRHISTMSGNQGIVLMYHEIQPDDSDIPAWTIVRNSDFLWQMKFIKDHFDTICLEEALERRFTNKGNKKPFAVITFDDGYSGNYHNALPIMRSLDIPFTVYFATKAIQDQSLYWYDRLIRLLTLKEDINLRVPSRYGAKMISIRRKYKAKQRWKLMQNLLSYIKEFDEKDREEMVSEMLEGMPFISHNKSSFRMLTVGELERLSRSKLVTVGSHTHGHELLNQLGTEEVISTVKKSNALLDAWTNIAPVDFAYPNGNYNNKVIDAIKRCGIRSATTTGAGILDGDSDPFKIPRLSIGRFESKGTFKAKVSRYL